MARELALTTQLKNANAKIAELEKSLASEKASKDMYYKNERDAAGIIEQLHQFLDAVPNSVPRESDGENSWSRVKRDPVTRLAAWLAIRH